MLICSFRTAVWPTCLLAGLLLVSGCSAKRHSTRGARVLHNITPEPAYNPPVEQVPLTPPAPRDADPLPPTSNTSDLPPAPPQDDFESAERPGRHSASFGPYTGRVTRASKSTGRPGINL